MKDKKRIGFFGVLVYFAVLASFFLDAQTQKGVETDSKSIIIFGSKEFKFNIENQWAFIVGINRYSNIRNLSNAVTEAKDMERILVQKYGFRPTRKEFDHDYKRVEHLYDKEATEQEIMKRLTWYQNNLEGEDSLFIYFSGHGYYIQKKKTGYWVPHNIADDVDFRKFPDNDDKKMKLSALKISDTKITRILRKCKAKHIFLIVDSCFAGAGKFFRFKGAPPPKALYKKSRQALTPGAKEVPDPSPFSRFLIKHLEENSESYLLASTIIAAVKKKFGSEFIPLGGYVHKTGTEAGEFVFTLANSPDIDKTPSIKSYHRACTYDEQKLYPKALFYYEKAIEVRPKYSEAYNNMGITYKKMGKNRGAIEALKKAIEIRPGYTKAYYNLGYVYDELGKYRDAIYYYNEAIKIDHNYSNAYNNMGVAYYRLDDFERAIAVFKEAAKINPEDSTVHCNLAEVYERLRMKKEAEKAKKRCQKMRRQR